MLPHGLQDELAIRLVLCCGILQGASIHPHGLPHGLQDELAVDL
jgi:hypothetical protein